MADGRYETVSTFVLPNEYQRQAAEARRRRRMAELMAQQAYQPGDIQNAPIPAAAPLVQGLQAFLAARGARKAEEAEESAQEAQTREARQFLKALTEEDTVTEAKQPDMPMGTPTVTAPQLEGGRITAPAQIDFGAPPPMEAPQVQLSRYGNLTQGQRRALALEGVLTSQNPLVQKIGQMQYGAMQPKQPEIGAVNPADFTPESLAEYHSTGNFGVLQSRAKAPTVAGGMAFNEQTGGFEPIAGYAEQQGSIAEARRPQVIVTGGGRNEPLVSVRGEDGNPILVPRSQAAGMTPYTSRTAAQEIADVERGRALEQRSIDTQNTLDTIGQLLVHPGRKAGTGASSFLGNIPGTDARGFQAQLETFKAQTFIPMVSALKGMGALSDAEGKKLSAAVGALDPAMKETEFEKELKRVAKFLYDKARAAGLNVVMPELPGGAPSGTQGGSSRSNW